MAPHLGGVEIEQCIENFDGETARPARMRGGHLAGNAEEIGDISAWLAARFAAAPQA